MKKIILFLLLIFTTIPGFTYDYREILFGNNYENRACFIKIIIG